MRENVNTCFFLNTVYKWLKIRGMNSNKTMEWCAMAFVCFSFFFLATCAR